MRHFAHAACPGALRPLRIETIAERDFGIVRGSDPIDQGKIVERIQEKNLLIESGKGWEPALKHLRHIAIGEMRLDHMDEGLSRYDAGIASAPGRSIHEREQIRHLT